MTEIFNSNNKLGDGHVNGGRYRYTELLSELPLSDRAISIFTHILENARDAKYAGDFGRVDGSNIEWMRLTGLRVEELQNAVNELLAIGLITRNDEGVVFVAEYNIFVWGGRYNVKDYLSQIGGKK